MSLSKITTSLWLNDTAEEAAKFYVSVFGGAPSSPNNPDPAATSAIKSTTYYTSAGQETHKHEPGSVMTVSFTLQSHPFVAVNGGPHFKFNPAISLQVICEDQAEVDYFWKTLGEERNEKQHRCGWLSDRWGLSWQIIPKRYLRMVEDGAKEGAKEEDKEGYGRALEKMLGMTKLDIEELEKAFRGE